MCSTSHYTTFSFTQSAGDPGNWDQYTVRPTSYHLETGKYKLTIGFHPTSDPKDTVYYDTIATGEKAQELSSLGIESTKFAVRISGNDLSREVSKKTGGKRMVHEIQAEVIERLPYRQRPITEIIRTKRKPSNH